MKNILAHIVSITFTAIFLVAMSGLPVFQHYCNKINLKDTSLLVNNVSCQHKEEMPEKCCCSHSKESKETKTCHSEEGQDNDNNCCSNSFYVVKLIENTILQQVKFTFSTTTLYTHLIIQIKENIEKTEKVFIDNTYNIYINPRKYLLYFLQQLKIPLP